MFNKNLFSYIIFFTILAAHFATGNAHTYKNYNNKNATMQKKRTFKNYTPIKNYHTYKNRNKHSFSYPKSKKSTIPAKKCAVITANMGEYDAKLKPFAKQHKRCDFIAFIDDTLYESILKKEKKTNGWKIDNTPYHILYPSPLDNGSYTNSLTNNPTPDIRSVYKYYKQQYYLIPTLQKYDTIIWIDGNRKITNPYFTYDMLRISEKYSLTITTNTVTMFDDLKHQIKKRSQKNSKVKQNWQQQYNYNLSQGFPNVKDPKDRFVFEDTVACDKNNNFVFMKNFQYPNNFKEGDKKWNKKFSSSHPKQAHWETYFMVIDNNNPDVKELFDQWYLQKLKFTTHDQLGFDFVVWQKNFTKNILTLDRDMPAKYMFTYKKRKAMTS